MRHDNTKPKPKVISNQPWPNRQERRHGGLGLTLFIKAMKAGVVTGKERNQPYQNLDK